MLNYKWNNYFNKSINHLYHLTILQINLQFLQIDFNILKIDLFVILKELWGIKQRSICDFLTSGFEADIVLKEILTEAHQRTNFKGDKVYLLKRIQKLVSNQTFSVRENKLLKNLVGVQLQTNKLNFSQIEYFLPGKKSEIVRREIGKLMLQI